MKFKIVTKELRSNTGQLGLRKITNLYGALSGEQKLIKERNFQATIISENNHCDCKIQTVDFS